MGNKRKTVLIIIGIIIALVVIAVLYHDYKPELQLVMHLNHHNQQVLLKMLRAKGPRDMGLLLLLVAVFAAIPGLSNSVICILAGLCYGPLIGFFINWLGNILGNFVVLRLIKQISFSTKFKHRKLLEKLMHQKYPVLGLIIGYMVPVIPMVMVNYTSAQMKYLTVKFRLGAIALGVAPASFLYAFGGDAILKGDMRRIIIALVGIAVLIMLYLAIRKRRSQSKADNTGISE